MSINELPIINTEDTEVEEEIIQFNPTENQQEIQKGRYVQFDVPICNNNKQYVGAVRGVTEKVTRERRRKLMVREIKVDCSQRPISMRDDDQPISGIVTLIQKYDA